MADNRRFLLVRLDGLGDALTCVPALEGLRRARPDAEFGAVCSPANAALFDPALVRVHVLRDESEEAALIAELRAADYTDALIATEEPQGYRLGRASGCIRRAGFWHRFEKTFKSIWQYAQLTERVYRPAAWVDQPEPEVSAIYRLAETLGASRPIPAEAATLARWLNVKTSEPPVVSKEAFAFQIAPKLCTSGWGQSSIARVVVSSLAASPFVRCVLLASTQDAEIARSVLEQARLSAADVSLAPSSDLPRWLGAIASSEALVSPDTGAAHAAGMLGVPVVDLFDLERFEQLSRQWLPWAAPARCIVKPAYERGAEERLGAQIGAALHELARAPRAVG